MISTYRRLKRRRDAGEIDGFTLIELLIVIVVLGILAAVVIFALGGITGKSAVASCQADGATVSTAISAFNAQNPGATVTQAMLVNASSAYGSSYGGSYIQSWPNNGTHYVFAIANGAVTYLGITGTPAAGTLVVQAATGGNNNGLPGTAGWAVYGGPTACANVQ
jgi:prepilin-type N-terminal cleavage/methylation domain-containing protein